MSAPLLPPELWQDIAQFVAEGKTGKIIVSIKCGVITGYDVNASRQTRWPERAEPRIVELSSPARRIQSR